MKDNLEMYFYKYMICILYLLGVYWKRYIKVDDNICIDLILLFDFLLKIFRK